MNLLGVTELVMEMEHRTHRRGWELHLVSLAKRRLGSLHLLSWRAQKKVCRARVNGLGKLQLDTRRKKAILQKLKWWNMTQRSPCRISMVGDIQILGMALNI